LELYSKLNFINGRELSICSWELEKMPVVHVNVWEGFGKEKTKIVIKNIIKVFVDLDIPSEAVEVIVHEIPKTHWGIGGVPASEKFKGIPTK
jgi:4-oxalocrotonate tautomerase